MPFDQKFDLVSESHQFSYQFFILSVGIAQNACVYTNELDSKAYPPVMYITCSPMRDFAVIFILVIRQLHYEA